MSVYLPRFLIAVVAVPAAFVLAAFAAVRVGFAPQGPAAIVGAVTFALVVMAPSTKNAAVRAAIVLAVAAVGFGLSSLLVSVRA